MRRTDRPQAPAPLGGAGAGRTRLPHVRRAVREGLGDERGLTLIEVMVAIAIVTIVMAALTVLYVDTMSTTSHLRSDQSASSLSTTALDTARGYGATDAVSGRAKTSVTAQFAAANSTVQPWLATMDMAYDTTLAAGATGSPDLPLSQQQTVGGQVFTVTYYVGWCYRNQADTATSASCVPAASKLASAVYTQEVQVVAAVSWTDTACSGDTCTHVAAVILNGTADPVFNFNDTPPPTPSLTSCGSQTSVVGYAVSVPVSATGSSCPTSGTVPLVSLTGGVPTFTWSASGLPAGLSLTYPDGSTPTITGTPTAATSGATVTVTVTDAFLHSASVTLTWVVKLGVSLTAVSAQTSVVGTAVTAVSTTASNGLGSPYTFTESGLPPGISGTTSGGNKLTLSGTPTAAGSYSVTIAATDSGGYAGSTTFTWTVYNPLTVTNPGNQTSTVNTAIVALPIPVTGGSGSYTMALASGYTLPNGLSLTGNATTGYSITGTPTAVAAAKTIKITATDSKTVVPAVTISFTWTIVAAPVLNAIANQTTNVGQPATLTVTTSSCANSPCQFTATGVPSWLTFNGTTGTFTGTAPLTAPSPATVTITVTAVDVDGGTSAAKSFTWTVRAAPVVINPGNQTDWVNDRANLQVGLAACQNAPCTFTATGLPTGLSISTAGLITGTLSTASTSGYTVTVTAKDSSGQTGTASFTWYVYPVPSLGYPSPQKWDVGYPVNVAATLSCSAAPCTVTAGGLPSGVAVDPSSAAIGGTPTGTGSGTATITVTDSGGHTGTATLAWTVYAAPTIADIANQVSTVGVGVSLAVSGSCSATPCSYTASGLPTGLSINASTGAITGTPSAAGSTTATVTITDAAGDAAATDPFTWTVYATPTISYPAPGTWEVGQAVSLTPTIACGSSHGPCTLTVTGALPSGVTLAAGTGVISGTPTASATGSITVTIKDVDGRQSSATVTWSVVQGPTIQTPASQASTWLKAISTVQVTSTCPAGGCRFSATGLPTGLTINSTSGAITGTPTQIGNYSVVITITDRNGNTAATNTFNWTVSWTGGISQTVGSGRNATTYCLDYVTTGRSASVTADSCNTSAEPQWTLAADGTIRYGAATSTSCLVDPGTTNGTPTIATCNGATNQTSWQIDTAGHITGSSGHYLQLRTNGGGSVRMSATTGNPTYVTWTFT